MLSTAQPELDIPALDKRIAAFENAYQHARAAHVKFFTRNAWGKFNARNPDDLLSITIEKQVLQKLWAESEAILNILKIHRLYDNVFFVTMIKLKALCSRVAFATGDFKTAEIILTEIIGLLHGLKKQHKADVNSDLQFQHEITCVLRMFVQLLRNDKKEQTPQYGAVITIGYEIGKKWPPTIHKLQNIYNYWYVPSISTAPIRTLNREEKTEFIETYTRTITDLKTELAVNPFDATLAIDFARANMLAFCFEINLTHDWQKHPLKTEEEIKKYLKHTQTLINNYVIPSIRQLLIANPKSLQENAEPIVDIVPILNEFRTIVVAQSFSYVKVREKAPENLKYLLSIASLDLVDLEADTHEISHCFNLNASRQIVKEKSILNLPPEAFQALRQASQDMRSEFDVAEKKRKAAQLLQASEATNLLIELEEKEQKCLKAIKTRLEKRGEKKSKKTTTTSVVTNDSTLHCFTRAQYFSRNLRTHREAVEMYQHAYSIAVKSNDLYCRLAALDGELFARGRVLAKKIKSLHATLNFHIKSVKKVPQEKRQDLSQLTREVSEELHALQKLHVLYNSISHTQILAEDKSVGENIAASKKMIGEIVHQHGREVASTNELFEKLKAELKLRRDYIVRRVGGEEVFKAIGEAKKRAGKKLSEYSAMRDLADKLSKDFKQASESINKLAMHYQLPAEPVTGIPDKYQKAFDQVPEGSLMIGSNVIAYSTKDKSLAKFEAHDFDFVTPKKNEQELIARGFNPCIYQPGIGLYQKTNTDVTVAKDETPSWIAEDAKLRDFTICAVYLDKKGKRYDPTGKGIDDIANKRLRMIGNPTERLREDPTRALRAIRFIVAGFKPDQALIDALNAMTVPKETHFAHLNAVLFKHLSYLDRKQYVALLHEYGLLEKLFGIKCKTNVDLAVWRIERLLKLPQPTQTKHTVFFTKTVEDFPELGTKTVPEFKH